MVVVSFEFPEFKDWTLMGRSCTAAVGDYRASITMGHSGCCTCNILDAGDRQIYVNTWRTAGKDVGQGDVREWYYSATKSANEAFRVYIADKYLEKRGMAYAIQR